MTNSRLLFLPVFLLAVVASAPAGQRRFTYSYEATTSAPGAIEIENWVTWKSTKNGDGRIDRFDFRHELEWGITDRLQLGLYLADWTYRDGGDEQGARYHDSAVELIYNLSNPQTSFLGSALYGEVKIGDEVLALEGKLILQKNVGALLVAYNVTLEGEWEGEDFDEEVGEFQQTLGVSYQISPSFSVGAEFFHEIEFPEWSEAEDSVVYAGPNASVRYRNVFATVTPLVQLTDVGGEPDFQTRVIVGFDF